MLLLKDLPVYSSQYIGIKDILICGTRVEAIADKISIDGIDKLKTLYFDSKRHFAVPGFVDGHVHLIGGGGEGGFSTRTREGTPEEFACCGTTAVVGMLGTDSITRDHISLLAKARTFREWGLGAWVLTGSYRYPIKTITGDLVKDIVLIPEVIGVGEVAVSDHRGSNISGAELQRLAMDTRVAAMLAGKKGIVVCHMGNAPEGMKPLFQAVENGSLPPKHFIPTHISRNDKLLEEGIKWVKENDGFIDLTAGKNTSSIIMNLRAELGNLNRISVSSDGLGSLPKFDEDGKLIEITAAPVDGLLRVFKELLQKGLSVEEAIKPVCSVPATALGLNRFGYGKIEKGYSASLLVFNTENLNLELVLANGKIVVQKGTLADQR